MYRIYLILALGIFIGSAVVFLVPNETKKQGFAIPSCGTMYTRIAPNMGCEPVGRNLRLEGPTSNEKAVVAGTPLTILQLFIADMQASTYYKSWSTSYPTDLQKWVIYRNATLAGMKPSRPTMTTKFGNALIDTAALEINATQ